MPGSGATSVHAAQDTNGESRRGGPDRRHHRAGHPVWALRLPAYRSPSTQGGLGGERETRGADLAAGGGLKVAACRQPKKGRLWLNDGSCIRLRPEHPNHVWSYDFVEDRTHNGKKFRMLNVIDEFTRECLAIRIGRKLNSTSVIDVLSDLFLLGGVPGHVRSDNGPEFIAKAVRDWIAAVGARTAFIEPGSPRRMAIARASTPSSATNSSTARSSTA